MATSVPTTDPLVDKLSLTELKTFAATSATTTTGATVNMRASDGKGPMPLSLAVCLVGQVCAAAHTLDVTVEGSNDNFTTSAVVATFAQMTNASVGVQRKNISTQYQYYRAKGVSAGAFGSSEVLRASVVLVGTDLRNAGSYTSV